MSIRRLSAVGAATLFSLCLAAAQEPANAGGIPNWTAPPFWTPPLAREVSAWKEQGLLPEGTDVVEGLPTSALPFFAIAPCRIVDTRPIAGFPGAYGPPAMAANASRDFDLNSAAHCPGIPANAEAYSINVTVTETTGLGDVRMWPAGSPPAVAVSTQNWPTAGLSIANAAIVPAGTGGAITVFVAGSATHLIIDINGYYAPIAIVNTVNGLSGAVTLAAGSNVTITPTGNTLTIAAAGGGAAGWSLTGNAGTTAGTNFLGTTDNQALEVKVNGLRALRLEPDATSPNLIGGYFSNAVTSGVKGATIGGGGALSVTNRVTDDYGTVAGGYGNRAGDAAGTTEDRAYATVAGGSGNIASGTYSAVAGGSGNAASGLDSFVGGGTLNQATGDRSVVAGGQQNTAGTGGSTTVAGGYQNSAQTSGATVGGGLNNTAWGLAATVPGGRGNLANTDYTFAAGRRAVATHIGAFVWGDSTDANVASTAVNQFIVRASGGIWLGTTSTPSLDIATNFLTTSTGARLTIGGVWTDNSDRDSKENFQEIDEREILSRVATLPITRWSYKAEGCDIEHLGPMAQDFSAAFGLGGDDRSISTLDSSGVALAAIQALYELGKEKDRRIEALEARIAKLEGSSSER